MDIACDLESDFESVSREVLVRRVAFQLTRFTGAIHDVHVGLRESNKGAKLSDFHCTLVIRLVRGIELVFEHDAASAGEALEFCLMRATRSMAKAIELRTDRLVGARGTKPGKARGYYSH